MMQPAELLKDFGMLPITGEDLHICFLGVFVLLLLLVHVSNLEPDVGLVERRRRGLNDIFETLQRPS